MRKILSFVVILLSAINSYGQLVVDNAEEDKRIYFATVKQVDEFIHRFNCEDIKREIDTSEEHYKMLNIISLFNEDMFSSMDTQKDSTFDFAVNFALQQEEKPTQIAYEDTTWFARAECKVTYKNQVDSIVLWLAVQNRRAKMYKWVICQAEGEILKLTPSNTADNIMITPNSHTINFMMLSDITTQNLDYITNYKHKNYKIDQTSVFFTLVNQGLLKINYVSKLEFVFMQIPGYSFSIREFTRNKMNAGWLINKINKMSDNEKKDFYEWIYSKK